MKRFLRNILQVIAFLFQYSSLIITPLIKWIISFVLSQQSQKRRLKVQHQTRDNQTIRNHQQSRNQQLNWSNNGKGIKTRKSNGNFFVESSRRQYINHTLTYRRNYWPLRPSKTHLYKKSSMQANCSKSPPLWFSTIIKELAGFMTPMFWVSLIVLLFVLFITRHD